ncbi:hypothetical protein HBB16_00180 [Pseudonocardia sp. MCCB 268]|nr:hypothetical protein [Pseudonocardia cytotoxica]
MLRTFGRGSSPRPARSTSCGMPRRPSQIPAEFWCGVLLDPSTLDLGGLYDCSFPDEVLPRLFESSTWSGPVPTTCRLARRSTAVSVLQRVHRGGSSTTCTTKTSCGRWGCPTRCGCCCGTARTRGAARVVPQRAAGFTADEIEVASALGSPAAGTAGRPRGEQNRRRPGRGRAWPPSCSTRTTR